MTLGNSFATKVFMQSKPTHSLKDSVNLPGPLVTTEWLAANRSHPKLIILDASLNPVGKVINDSSLAKQIPGARFFDFDKKICDQMTALPHMMPSAEIFQKEVRSLGINSDSCIIVYDRIGVYSSPRARWMFKAMGHNQIAVLDGGLPQWIADGHETENLIDTKIAIGGFVANPVQQLFCDGNFVASVLSDSSTVVLDARSNARFTGLAKEPRSGLRSGHMPNALNLPFEAVVKNGKIVPKSELIKIFTSLVKPNQKIITTCGSGVTACIIAFAAELAGYKEILVYDGSWAEWGIPSSRPVVT
jgi:thiosulfate/3-mercaptopyruvate sulfurtransferase